MCACAYVSVYVCVFAWGGCVRQRERKRVLGSNVTIIPAYERERERINVSVCMCVYVCVCDRESV